MAKNQKKHYSFLNQGEMFCYACKAVQTSQCPHLPMTARKRRRMVKKESQKDQKNML